MIVVDATALQTEHKYRGSGTYAASLLDAMTSLQHPELGLLAQAPQPSDLPLLGDLLRRPGVESVRLLRPRRPRYHLQWLWSMGAVPLALRHARPRFYHATEPDGLVTGTGVTTLFTLCDLTLLRDPNTHFPPRRLDQRLGYGHFLHQVQRADRLIAISQATKCDAVERLHIPPDRITVVPLAADARRFYPRSQPDIDAACARHGLRRPYFIHVGASVPHKNTANILRAFDLFCRDGRGDHALYIVGRWHARALGDLARTYGRLIEGGRLRVSGFGPDDDLSALYSGADALGYPSLNEGFGLPVLEAMRCATPVITSNRSSLPEAGGDAALYVDPNNMEDIAGAMQRLADSPTMRAELVTRGRAQARRFSWERTARETLRVYEDLL